MTPADGFHLLFHHLLLVQLITGRPRDGRVDDVLLVVLHDCGLLRRLGHNILASSMKGIYVWVRYVESPTAHIQGLENVKNTLREPAVNQ